MVAVREEVLGFGSKVVGEVGYFLDDPQCAQRGLEVGVNSECTSISKLPVTFFRMYVLLEPSSFSISLARSRDISSDAMLANVHSARPTAYMLEWFMSLDDGLVSV